MNFQASTLFGLIILGLASTPVTARGLLSETKFSPLFSDSVSFDGAELPQTSMAGNFLGLSYTPYGQTSIEANSFHKLSVFSPEFQPSWLYLRPFPTYFLINRLQKQQAERTLRPVQPGPIKASLTTLPLPQVKKQPSGKIDEKLRVASLPSSKGSNYVLDVNAGTNGGLLFGTSSKAADLTKVKTRWTDLEDRIALTSPKCDGKTCFPSQWKSLIDEALALPARKRLLFVNISINKAIKYKTDRKIYASQDYWATPYEAFSKGGDCEDFVIAKYWMLKDLGYNVDDMRMTVVRDTTVKQWHAVLSVKLGDDWAILDNRFSRIRLSEEMPNLQAVYSINETGTWLQKRQISKSLNQMLAKNTQKQRIAQN